MKYDVVIVGAGPSGLAAAIKLKQLNSNLNVCILEKGAEVGAHILSGNVFETKALDELLPNWKEEGAPIKTKVSKEKFLFLSKNKSFSWPTWLLPAVQKNHSNYIISLANLCRWLAEQAEKLGIEIFPGFPASEILYKEDGSVKGVVTLDMGLDKDGNKKETNEQGMELHAKVTVFAEGCRGHLGKNLIKKYHLDQGKDPQQFGIGFKEIWEVSENQHQEGLVIHTAGWPLDNKSFGGSFVYHAEKQKAMGFCVYNNIAVGAYYLLEKYKLKKVAIIDFDVHHGNGTQDIFYDNEKVLYISSHQYPYYPGSGAANEKGNKDNVLNVPLSAGTQSHEFLNAYDSIFKKLKEFKPEFILLSAGFDAHKDDPLAQINLESKDYYTLTKRILSLAKELCSEKVVSILEGGYDLNALKESVDYHVKSLMENQ